MKICFSVDVAWYYKVDGFLWELCLSLPLKTGCCEIAQNGSLKVGLNTKQSINHCIILVKHCFIYFNKYIFLEKNFKCIFVNFFQEKYHIWACLVNSYLIWQLFHIFVFLYWTYNFTLISYISIDYKNSTYWNWRFGHKKSTLVEVEKPSLSWLL